MIGSAFKQFEKTTAPIDQLPKVNLPGRLTGGLQALYASIGKKKRPNRYGRCTGANGRFEIHRAAMLAERYRIVDVIGQGTFAVFIEAEDVFWSGGRRVGVKIFDSQNKSLGFLEAKYMREINRSNSCESAHIIRLLNAFLFDRHACLVYELLSSRCLRHGIEVIPPAEDCQSKRMTFLRQISIQVLTALNYLSVLNIIHADLKPENVLFVHDAPRKNSIKVIDFGNALHNTPSELEPYYEKFDVQSLWYRAPEVLLGVEIGLPIDVWSVGCILLELYVGRPVFKARRKQDILDQMVRLLGPLPDSLYKKRKFATLLAPRFENPKDSCRITASEKIYAFFSKMRRQGRQEREFADFLSHLLCYCPNSRARPSKALLHPFLKCELPLQLCLNEAPLYNETNWGDDRFSIDRSKCATLLRRNDSDEAVTEQMILQNSRGEIELKSSGIAARTYAERDKTSVGETNGLIEPKKRKLSTEDDAVVLLELGAEGTTKTGVAEKAESSESEDDIILLEMPNK
ncbi:uncharacterized protein [Oscarella lobularis]|uniref:uncharacterized protein isoform X2 n=1 Tax=Oscarella lobularis TaxID=121494 RepID=UPI00331337FA